MKFSEALAAIKSLENGADLASAIESEVEGLKGKNFEIIGEKRNATTKAQAYQTALEAIAKALQLDGNIDEVLNAAEQKVRELVSQNTTAQTKLTETEQRAIAAEGKVKAAERQSKLTQAAAKAGANAGVLERLLGDKVDELAIADDGVRIGDKPLREYVEGDEGLKPFIPALFPTAEVGKVEEKRSPMLPSGGPGGNDKGKANPVTAQQSRIYGGGLKALKK